LKVIVFKQKKGQLLLVSLEARPDRLERMIGGYAMAREAE